MKTLRTQLLMATVCLFCCFAIISFKPKSEKTEQEKQTTEAQGVKTGQEELINALTQEEIDEGWVLLFDGETSNGWRGYNKETFPEEGWEIKDGMLRCIDSGRGEAGGKGGDIITEKKYRWFEFKLEWKIAEGGNSGILYLAQEKPDQPIWKSAPEMQILDNEGHPVGADAIHQAGALYDLIPAEPQNAKPANEWNKVKIFIKEGLVQHWQNGEKVVEYHLWTLDWKKMVINSKFKDYPDFVEPAEEGHIGLQDHGNDVWYRNIKIKELK